MGRTGKGSLFTICTHICLYGSLSETCCIRTKSCSFCLEDAIFCIQDGSDISGCFGCSKRVLGSAGQSIEVSFCICSSMIATLILIHQSCLAKVAAHTPYFTQHCEVDLHGTHSQGCNTCLRAIQLPYTEAASALTLKAATISSHLPAHYIHPEGCMFCLGAFRAATKSGCACSILKHRCVN